jgi:ABC-type protease/lipase transport system fused ATPase/permease subunit
VTLWAGIVAVLGTVGMVVAGAFAARATTRAAAATAEATRAAARVQVEPNQRQADLEAFKAIRDDMQEELSEMRTEQRSLKSLVRAFAGYVGELTTQMRSHGIEPPAPPERVDEYNRTGV